MSEEGQSGRLLKGFMASQVALWFLAPVLALVALVAYQTFGRRSISGPETDTIRPGEPAENFLAQVRTTLAKQTDLNTCRSVVQMLNAHLQKAKEHAVTPLSADDSETVRKLLGIDKADLAEVNATTFTPLDAHHLEACLLLREVARTLEVQPVEASGAKVAQKPLERAAAAFAWVRRQVRLQVPGQEVMGDDPAPVAHALRLGRGNPVERALVFLALLEQFGLDDDERSGLQGCLLLTPNEKGQKNFWACGVAVGGKPDAIYLFDPRLGLPVPGPGGKGIATLAQARDDPSVLEQLKIDKLTYDITPAVAKTATLSLVCPLSAAAPRMLLLQNRLLRDRVWGGPLPAAIRVRLAEDRPAKMQEDLRAAAKSAGAPEVTFSPAGSTLLRRFLPEEEGGSDVVPTNPAQARPLRQQVFYFQAVPWNDLPPIFRDSKEFRPDNPLGDRLRRRFMEPFVRPLLEANSSRDLALRGRYGRAVPEFVREQDQWLAMRRRLQDARDLNNGVADWVERAIPAYAALIRARGTPGESAANAGVEALWQWQPSHPMHVLMYGAIGGARGADVMYQLALCRHEQALRYQARVELATRAGQAPGSDLANARKTWIDAEGYWKEYLDGNPNHAAVASARRLRGEAKAMQGRREEGIALLQDVSAPSSEWEKLACLWLAKQLAAAKGG